MGTGSLYETTRTRFSLPRTANNRLRLVLAVMTLFAAEMKAGTKEQLTAYRDQIDSLDQRIVELIQERARVVEKVGNTKREAHLPVTVPKRDEALKGRPAFQNMAPGCLVSVPRISKRKRVECFRASGDEPKCSPGPVTCRSLSEACCSRDGYRSEEARWL
jgi:hypothetical protein